MDIRPYQPADARLLARVHRSAAGEPLLTAARFRRLQARLLAAGGLILVGVEAEEPIAYTSAAPVPGLAGLAELQIYVDPMRQRQGIGSRLLLYLRDQLEDSPFRQLTHPVSGLDSPAARFLQKHDFFIEHEERQMVLDSLVDLGPVSLPAGFRLRTFSRPVAIRHLRRLYESSFAGLPWYQPYESDAEVSADLADATDILFLLDRQRPVGFIWMRWPGLDEGEIEPLGIETAYRRRGLGRSLLLAGLRQMAAQGARRVGLGVWFDNVAATNLYRRVGFRPVSKLTYLTLNLKH